MTKIRTVDDMKELEKLSNYAKKAIVIAFDTARKEGSNSVSARHLFIGILSQDKSIGTRLLSKLGVDTRATLQSLKPLHQVNEKSKQIKFDETTKSILVESYVIASDMHHVYTGTEHLLLAILKYRDIDFVEDLNKAGIDRKKIETSLSSFATYHSGVFSKEGNESIIENESEEETSALAVFTQNMNEMERSGSYLPIYGRDNEIERTIHILSRKTKSNPILVGEAGVGKTAIVEGLVERINSRKVPLSFKDKKIINLDISGILAGSKIRGDVEERVLDIINEASSNPNIVLFIDEIHMIVGAGSAGQGSMDIANILKPHLTNGTISVIGATTLDEYQQYFESDSALARRFQPVFVEEVSTDDAIKALENICPKLEEYHNVKITKEAIIESVKLSKRYVLDRYLPDKAIDILDEAAAGQKIAKDNTSKEYLNCKKKYDEFKRKKFEALDNHKIQEAAEMRTREIEYQKKLEIISNKRIKEQKTKFIVDLDQVRKVVSKLSKIPLEKMDDDMLRILGNFEKNISKKIVGQVDAINRISTGIKRAKVGIQDERRPLASFLFLGPSGVGKTETAKVIAEELFGSENAIIQLDMSEFMEQHAVSKLIGAPPGYVGFQEGGQFTEKVRRNPYSVILLDEIEKAHPDLLNILLQVLEEGRLRDGKGRNVNFRNTIIIMTSNIGAEKVTNDNILGFNLDGILENDPKQKNLEKAYVEMKERLTEELKKSLRPELLNRIDDVIIFRGLSDQDMIRIVRLEIGKLNKRIAEKGYMIAVSEGGIEFIAQKGLSKEYGARNIRRTVQNMIESELAELILKKGIGNLDETRVIKVTKVKEGLKFQLD